MRPHRSATIVMFGAALAPFACARILSYDDLGFEGAVPSSDASGTHEGGISWPDVATEPLPLPVSPTCNAYSLQLTGSVAGEAVNACWPRSSHSVNQATTPAVLDAVFGTQGALELSWNGVALEGVPLPVSGRLRMPDEGPLAGALYCLGEGSSISIHALDVGARLFYFELRSLSEGATCPGTPVTGTLDGYFQTN